MARYGYRYRRPRYSKEQIARWEASRKRWAEYYEKHAHVTEKVYKVNDLYIFCVKHEYDECLKKKNYKDYYVISIWDTPTRHEHVDHCLVHKTYVTKEEANEDFKYWKSQCEIGL